LCTPASLHAALRSLTKHKSLIVERLRVREKTFDESMSCDASLDVDEALQRLRLKYLAPCDCQHLDLPAESLDVIVSRAVLEHIPPPVIDNIFSESFRLLKPGGLVCHFVDNSDHWEFRDKGISRVNFLKFSDSAFRWTCLNKQNYQNRLRHPEYREMLLKAGFRVIREERKIDSRALTAIENLPVDQRFRSFANEDLAAIDSSLLAAKPSNLRE
jgi:SAM-dependent methyltransferase